MAFLVDFEVLTSFPSMHCVVQLCCVIVSSRNFFPQTYSFTLNSLTVFYLPNTLSLLMTLYNLEYCGGHKRVCYLNVFKCFVDVSLVHG